MPGAPDALTIFKIGRNNKTRKIPKPQESKQPPTKKGNKRK